MYPKLSRFLVTAERNVVESCKITEAQRALVDKLNREGNDATIAIELLRAAQATEDMFKAHFDQLKRLTLLH